MFVQYNIKCGEGEIAFLNITNLDLEEKNCMDPNLGEERFVRVVCACMLLSILILSILLMP